MAFTTIAKASVHFDCPTWTGSDSTTTITGMGFKPDALLIKNYSGTGDAIFNNSTRGTAHNWRPNQSAGSDTTVYVASAIVPLVPTIGISAKARYTYFVSS